MKKLLVVASSVLFFLTSTVFAASIQSLTKQSATHELSDKTITTIPMVTMNGQLIDNTVTIFFAKDGTVSGMFSTKPDNDPKDDTGKWVVKSDGTLCATWDHWNQNKPICVAIYKVKNSLIFINHDTKKLETIVLLDNIKEGNQVN